MKRWWLSLFVVVPSLIVMSMERVAVSGNSFAQTREITVLRNIGHQVLLSSGDSTSRVLPIEETAKGTYVIRFEKPFAMVPDSLVGLFAEYFSGIADYSVEVKNCQANELIYSFVISPGSADDIIPCLGRDLDNGCYELTVRVSPQRSPAIYYLAGLATLLALAAAWFFYKKSKATGDVSLPLAQEAEQESVPAFVSVGHFHFYPSRQKLELNGTLIELTGKESQLLTILANAPNAVVERERLQKIWEDEGVIVTRSLDMFISKLRKKLKDDPSVSIVNVHGKGYRLEIDNGANVTMRE